MTGTAPWLSVVMPLYEGERFVAAALESVAREVAATGERVEVVVADDASTDKGPELVAAFADRLDLQLLPAQRLGSWVATTNRAVAAAHGEWICFLHQDDLWLPGRLAALRALAGDTDVILTASTFVDETGDAVGRWSLPWRTTPEPAEIARRFTVQNFVSVPSVAVRRSTLLAAGPLDPSLWYTADWDLWLRLVRAGRVASDVAATVAFRIHGGSQTQSGTRDAPDYRDQLEQVLHRHSWALDGPGGRPAAAAARASLELNLVLASLGHGVRPPLRPALAALVRTAGPRAGLRLARDSRLADRLGARVRARRRGRL